jgi:hypothetical protein
MVHYVELCAASARARMSTLWTNASFAVSFHKGCDPVRWTGEVFSLLRLQRRGLQGHLRIADVKDARGLHSQQDE